MYLKNDITDVIGEYGVPQPGYSVPTQEELDVYLLVGAKTGKLIALKESLNAFADAGYLYSANTYSLTVSGISNVILKNDLAAGAIDKYKYYNMSDVQIDFTDEAGWALFFNGITQERDRLMRVFCAYIAQINACTTVAAVDAIVISFSI